MPIKFIIDNSVRFKKLFFLYKFRKNMKLNIDKGLLENKFLILVHN